ncbi:hypothetical protein [Lutibacter sp.]
MIFKDLLEKYHSDLRSEFEKILDLGLKKQFYSGDLLLWKINGFYKKDLENFKSHENTKLNPHVIGTGIKGYSEQTHYEFINQYRHLAISEFTFVEYLEKIECGAGKKIDDLILSESISIQLEMLIYLKIWEADLIIKKFYELTRILNGEPYDWYFKIAESSRDKNATGTRQEIIRKLIRNKLENTSPFLKEYINSIYRTQIRNSIAHSNYSITGRNINLNNYIKKDPAAQLHNIKFNDWHKIFHKLLLLYNEYIWLENRVNDIYVEKFSKGEKIEILVTEKMANNIH